MVQRALSRNQSVGILAVAILLASCGTPGKNLPVTERTAARGSDGVQEIRMRVESFYFEPSRVHLTVNVPVRLILKSGTFLAPHNFSLHASEAGIDIDADVGHGKTVTVEFTASKTGEYKFFCDVGSHADKGMVGTLVVEPQ